MNRQKQICGMHPDLGWRKNKYACAANEAIRHRKLDFDWKSEKEAFYVRIFRIIHSDWN